MCHFNFIFNGKPLRRTAFNDCFKLQMVIIVGQYRLLQTESETCANEKCVEIRSGLKIIQILNINSYGNTVTCTFQNSPARHNSSFLTFL